MTLSPVELPDEDVPPVVASFVSAHEEDSSGPIVTMTPAVSPLESVTEVPFAGLPELHAAAANGSAKRRPVRAILTA